MTAWQHALEQAGAVLDTAHRLSTRTTEPTENTPQPTYVTPLLHQQLISVIGPEAHKFLQGQLSCDMTTIDQTGSGLGAHCTVKGAMIALYRLIAVEGGYWLRTSQEIREPAQSALNRYIIFSKAETTDLSEQIVGLGLSGPGAIALVEQLMDRAPSELNGVLRSGQRVAVKVPGNRYELWLPMTEAISLLPALLDQAVLGSTADWELQEIQAGLPDLRAISSEQFIPQMANLQAVGGVSFSKGCYTGQEIVTRLQHRGKLNKCMFRARVSTEQLPATGDYLHTAQREKVGQVLLAAPVDTQTVELLVIASKAQADEQTLMLESQNGPALELLPLPYVLDPELFERKA
ncbi:MAG: folate-binding protein [Marinobacterium sp.]|nr:folate-binding protein [Marinobacterium sp.]